jgi:hypothetical protein
MNEVLDAVQDLKLDEPVFRNVKFYVSGKAHEKVNVNCVYSPVFSYSVLLITKCVNLVLRKFYKSSCKNNKYY